MRISTAGTFAACVAAAAASKGTSPFVLFSTSELISYPKDAFTRQIQPAADALENTKLLLSDCPSDTYLIVTLPNGKAVDFSNSKVVPNLLDARSRKEVKTRFSIAEVVGTLDADDLQEYLLRQCGAEVMELALATGTPKILKQSKPLVVLVDAKGVQGATTAEHDRMIKPILAALPPTGYTVIYTTTPPSSHAVYNAPSYEPEFQEPLHMEMKRDTSYSSRADNGSYVDKRPLFEKYQFFTPGLFMGLFVTFLLMSILAVGINGVASLQVSYGAFDKEMGPAAQRKQQ